MSNPNIDEIARLADEANEQNKKASNPERIDIIFTTEADMLKAEMRSIHHQVLDKLLDAAVAMKYDLGDVMIQITAFKFSDINNAATMVEDIGKFVADMSDGAVEEMYVDHYMYKGGTQQKPETRTQLPIK